MLQYYEIEQLAFEQHAALLAAAAREQLLKSALDAADHRGLLFSLRCWLGGRLMHWGKRLQGEDATTMPELAVGQPYTSMSTQ
jgi:hypothetical protein